MKKSVSIWLFICAFAVFLMALIGAVTRLSESGLSIVEWKPITGALPPMNEAEWMEAFNHYQTSPQYLKINEGMSLLDFKHIFFWEWLHRLWGRLIGMIYFIPFVYFMVRRKIPASAKNALWGILGLGFLQGAMGWYMVKSGLVDMPAVSHYRLAAHLGLAFVIFCALFRMGLILSPLPREDGKGERTLRLWVKATLILVAITMTWGAFVAGLRAGLIYNTFPLMGNHFIPVEILDLQPWWINFFENHAAVQFTHRLLALSSFILMVFTAVTGVRRSESLLSRKLFLALGGMAFAQVGLGIATLLTSVNLAIATLHQAGALVILMILMSLLHLLKENTHAA
jgi:cytochrome c oxidase assembly protein subunit 15